MPSNKIPRRPATTQPALAIAALAAALLLFTGVFVALTAPPAKAQIQSNDIEVTVLAPDPQPTFKINTKVLVKLKNKGTADTGTLRLVYYWNRVSTGNYLNDHNTTAQNQAQSTCVAPPAIGGQVYCGDARLANIPAGGEITVGPLLWYPSSRQQGQGTIIVNVLRETDAAQSVLASGSRVSFVRFPKLEVVREYTIPPLKDDGTFRNPEVDCEVGKVNKDSCRLLPGQTALFAVTVHNMGNFNDFYTPNMTVTGSGLPPGWYVNLTPKDNVPSNSTYNIQVTAPRSGPGAEVGRGINVGTTENVKVFALSRANPTVEAEKIAAPHVIIRQLYDLNVTKGVHRGFGNISEPIVFNFTINNTGNGRDSYFAYFDQATSQINSAWNPLFSMGGAPTVQNINVNNLRALENRTVSLTVTPPPGTLKGQYKIGVVIKPNSTEDANPKIKRIEFIAQVNQTFMLSGSVMGPTVIPVVPAETASFELRIRNEGNGQDNATFRLENIPGGWTHRLTPSNGVLRLPPFGEAVAYFNLTPGARMLPNNFAEVFLNVSSQGPPELFPENRPRVNFTVHVDVVRGSNIVFTSPDTGRTPFVHAGGAVTFTTTVQNLGNVEDNLTFSIQRDPEWSASHNAPELLNLKAGQTRTVTLTVGAPATADIGARKVTTLTVESEFYERSGRANPSLSFAARVSGPDLSVTGLSLSRPVLYTDLNATLFVSVGNLGNLSTGNTTILIEAVSAAGAPRTLATRPLTPITGGERRQIAVDFVPTEHALEGSITFRATVDPPTADQAQGLVREIDEENNLRNITSLVHRLDLRVFAAAGQDARPGQELRYLEAPHAFVVQNAGNAIETVVVNISSERGWGYVQTQRDLRAGERVTFPITLKVPAFPGVKDDRLVFRLTMPGRADVVKTDATAITRLVDLEAPRIDAFTARPQTVSVGQATNLTATIRDATGVSSGQVVIRTPLNQTVTRELVPAPGNAYYYNHIFDVIGTYTAYVDVADASVPPNKNTTRNSRLQITFDVRTGSAPTIRAAVDTKIPLRSGTAIPLDVTDPLGVGKVAYTIEGVEFTSEAPYRIDTTGLRSGSYESLVTATNIYGTKGTATVKFTVDNTAPAEPTVTMSPAKPKAGETATITIRSDGDAHSATVVIKRNGLVEATREADKAGPGQFRLRFTPLEGEYTVDVVVRDAAGNSRTLEAANAFKASTPSVGALALLAIAGAVALARKRT